MLNDSGQVIGIVSWTKADAQNLSFAIPSREVSHLKADRKVSLWEQPRSGRRVSSAGAAANMETAVSAEQQDRSPASSFLDFNHRLAEAAGKKVTVVLQEEGGEQKFTFTVPSGLK